MPEFALSEIIAHADRRVLAAVVTHLSGDARAVPDLRDRAQIEAKAVEVLPPYLDGRATPMPPSATARRSTCQQAAASSQVRACTSVP